MAFYILGRDYFCSWVFGACLILGLLLYISGVQAKSGLVPLYSLPYHFSGGYFGSSDSFGNKRLPDLSQPDLNPELTSIFPPPKNSPRLDHVRVFSPNPFNVYAVNLKPSAGTVCHAEAHPSDDRKLWRCYHGTGRQTVSVDLFLTQADDEASVSLAPNQAMTVHYAPSLSVEMPEGMPGVNQQPEPLFELFRNDGVEMIENHLRQQSQLQEKVSKALQVTSSMMDTSFWQGMDDQTAQWIQSINFKIINGYYKEEEEAQIKPDEYRSGDWKIAVGLDDIILEPGASIQLPADMAFPGVINRLAGGGDEEKSSGSPQESHGESSTESNTEGSAGDSTKSDEATSTDSSGESPLSSTQRRIPVKNEKHPQNFYTWIKSKWYRNDLCKAAREGDLNTVETLMAKGVDPDTIDESGRIPLITATISDHSDVVKALLANGANPNICDKVTGKPPLLDTAVNGQFAIAKALLDHGADPDLTGHTGTPMLIACYCHQFDVCKLLLDYGADPNPSLSAVREWSLPLNEAAWRGSLDVVNTLLAKGVDPNIRSTDRIMPLPLQGASLGGHPDVAKALLANGADPNSLNSDQYTALHLAAEKGHLSVVKVLLVNGADPNSLNSDQYTALHLAAVKGHLSVVKALLANGADARLRASRGLTALDYAEDAEVQEALRNFISLPRPLQHLSLVSIRTRLVEHRTKGQSVKSAIRSLPLPTQIKRLILNPPYPEDRKDPETD